jgi:hypothetical protein
MPINTILINFRRGDIGAADLYAINAVDYLIKYQTMSGTVTNAESLQYLLLGMFVLRRI